MMKTRIVLFGTLCLAAAAQTPPATAPGSNLDALAQAAQAAELNWQQLAEDLDARVAKFLPCDNRATRAIQEVASASATRLAALSQYMQALVESAAADTRAARDLLAAERESLAQVSIERSDTAQEQAGVESQILNLTASVGRRASLGPALEQLQQIQAMMAQRATQTGNRLGAEDRVIALLNDLVTAFENREEALKRQVSALDTERTRWNAFYTSRAERARVECAITGGGR